MNITYEYLRKFGSVSDQFISTTNNNIFVLKGELETDDDDNETFHHRNEIVIYKKLDFPRTNKYFDHNGKQQKHIQYGPKKYTVDSFVKQIEKIQQADEVVDFKISSDFISYIRNTIDEHDITHLRFHSREIEEKYYKEIITKKRVFVTCFDYRSFLTDYVSVKEKNLTIFEERIPQTQVRSDFSFTLKSSYFKKMKETAYEVSLLENDRIVFVCDEYKILMMNQRLVEPVITTTIEKDEQLVVSTLLSPRPELDNLFV